MRGRPARWFALAALVVAATVDVRAQLVGIKVDLSPVTESDVVRAGTSTRAALQIRLPDRLHVNANEPRDPLLIPLVLTVQPPEGVTVTEIVYPEPSDLESLGSALPLRVYEREFAIGVTLDLGPDLAPGEITVPAVLRYQACDETTCYPPTNVSTGWTFRVGDSPDTSAASRAAAFARIPFGRGSPPPPAETTPPSLEPSLESAPQPPQVWEVDVLTRLDDFAVRGTAGGFLGKDEFLEFVRNAEAGITPDGMFQGRGPLVILLLVLLGGLALNLTPCVLPMIPINLAIIGAGAQSGSRVRGFLLGGTYGAAMALVYGLLGLVVILTAGTFGTINASPWFNAAIAALFVILALAMFDLLVIDFSRLSSRFHVSEAGRGTFIVAFAMGAVAALLAGACVAPVVIQVVLFSSDLYAAGTTAALILPFFLGIGMALPWPVAGAGIAALPKPGPWMVRVKQAFGLAILVTAAYYGYTAYGLFANRWVDPEAVASSVEEKLAEGWHSSLAAGLDEAERDGKPVLIDMWATWCKNCLVMDQTTLADPDVVSALSGYAKVKFQAEDPSEESVNAIMQRLNAVGLPAYAILKAN
jgi:cytochrome c biogenesis protein CcdA